MSLSDRSSGRFAEQLRVGREVRLDELVAVAERQVVVGVDEQPPEQLRPPRCQRLQADGLDVGQGHQAQHPQPLLDADERRELSGRSRDPRCRGGTPPATWRRWFSIRNSTVARCSTVRPSRSNMSCAMRDALGRVVLVAPLADVVKQQRQHEQLGRLRGPASSDENRSRSGAARVARRSRFLIVSSVCSSTVYLWKKSRTTRHVIA